MFSDFPLLCPESLQCHSVLLSLFKDSHCPPIWPLFTPHQPQASSLFPQMPQAHFRLRAFALPAPGLHGPSFSGPERASLLTAALFRSLLLSSVREALLTPKLKQRAFIPSLSLFVPLYLLVPQATHHLTYKCKYSFLECQCLEIRYFLVTALY